MEFVLDLKMTSFVARTEMRRRLQSALEHSTAAEALSTALRHEVRLELRDDETHQV